MRKKPKTYSHLKFSIGNLKIRNCGRSKEKDDLFKNNVRVKLSNFYVGVFDIAGSSITFED